MHLGDGGLLVHNARILGTRGRSICSVPCVLMSQLTAWTTLFERRQAKQNAASKSIGRSLPCFFGNYPSLNFPRPRKNGQVRAKVDSMRCEEHAHLRRRITRRLLEQEKHFLPCLVSALMLHKSFNAPVARSLGGRVFAP